jgi:2-polyprenyl-3-methyl-5-hydroxy-6-metoxy-1,4-benzoquinol methylase
MAHQPEHTHCLICHTAQLQMLRGFNQVPLAKCKKCGFVFCKNIPSADTLNEYYKHYGKTDFISPITIKRYNEWLDKFEKYRKHNTLLDIGCGNGFLLEQAKQRGWKVYGTEYSTQLVQVCEAKGITMYHGALSTNTFADLEFDVITSIEVIEHINNPLEEMQHISRMLRTGGLFFCTTPNFNALSRYYLKDKYNIISYPEHLSYYTPKTLKYLMQKFHLQPAHVETTGISITRFNQSTHKRAQAVVSATSDDELLREKIETRWYLKLAKQILNGMFQITGTGYSLKGWFEKGM